MSDISGGTLQSAATTGNGSVVGFNGKAERVTFYTTFSAGTSAGVVTYETSDDETYTGAWAALGTESWGAANSKKSSTFVGAFAYVRARISTDIVGGAVSVVVKGN